ncbi:hypothetical protein KIW84_056842 [Lathyrus oleraceus]|uniref:Uncharacterized protein n=1 Tax=Pisum sativum TaxID=3888 RepID=A0A9D5AHD0_PEA|nr:hypothetical protein KIW84_056842 [Pisum sativum]
MDDEIKSLHDNHTWELIKKPAGARLVSCFHVKRKTEQAAGSGKGQRGRAREEEKLETNGICRINQAIRVWEGLEKGKIGADTRHTRVIRVSCAWYAYGVDHTRMSEKDDVLNVKLSLLVRVWAWAIRVWTWSGMGNTRMGIGNTRMGRIVIF